MNPEKALKYLDIAYAVSKLSKDTSTKVGAIIIGPANEIRSLGYNGAPRGCAADEDIRGATRPEKYLWFSHGELNAITNAARVGVPLDGCTLIVTHPPCMDCARAIVQAGIRAVYYPTPESQFAARWAEHIERTTALFKETGVAVHELQQHPVAGRPVETSNVSGDGSDGRDSPTRSSGRERTQVVCATGVRERSEIRGSVVPEELVDAIFVGVNGICTLYGRIVRKDGDGIWRYVHRKKEH